MTRKVEVAIIGSGTAGLNAMGQVIRAGVKDWLLINGGPTGTTCARVGCMPSKVLIQAADDLHRRDFLTKEGIRGGESLTADMAEALAYVRTLRDMFVGGVRKNSAPRLEGHFIDGYAKFVGPTTLEVDGETIEADRIVIAAGSTPVLPAAWAAFGDRVMTTDTFFEQETLPGSMGVLGLGVIGLELGQALARLGVDVVGVDMLETIGGLSDPAVSAKAVEIVGHDLPLWLGAAAELEEAEGGKLKITAGDKTKVVDKVLVSLGRRPNLDALNLAALGVPLDKRGLPPVDPQTMRIGDLPVFLAGDITGDKAILHEAADEGKIAGYNAGRNENRRFRRKVWLGITFCDPNIVTVGATWKDLEGRDDVVVGERDFAMQGRSRIMGHAAGLIRLYAEKATAKLLGAAMVVPRGEHLGHLLAWAIQDGKTALDLTRMPFYHPVVEEGLQNALDDILHKSDLKVDGIPTLPFAD